MMMRSEDEEDEDETDACEQQRKVMSKLSEGNVCLCVFLSLRRVAGMFTDPHNDDDDSGAETAVAWSLNVCDCEDTITHVTTIEKL